MNSSRIQVVELLRFIAAAAIVMVHLPTVPWNGSWGVDMFFIISGFVMMLSTEKSHQKFFTKRLIRIVPIYWVMTLLIFGVAFIAPKLLSNTTTDFGPLLKSLFFMPFDKNGAGHFPVLFVGWTLNYEMFFYGVFALALFLSAKNKEIITAAVFFGLVVTLNFVPGFLPEVYGSPIILEFVLGLALYEMLTHRRWTRILFYAAIYGFPLWLTDATLSHRAYQFGFPCFLAALMALTFFNSMQFPKIFVTLGGASYALYLSHPYVIQFCDKALHLFRFDPAVNMVLTSLVFAVTLGVALLIYKYFEQPVTKWLRVKLT